MSFLSLSCHFCCLAMRLHPSFMNPSCLTWTSPISEHKKYCCEFNCIILNAFIRKTFWLKHFLLHFSWKEGKEWKRLTKGDGTGSCNNSRFLPLSISLTQNIVRQWCWKCSTDDFLILRFVVFVFVVKWTLFAFLLILQPLFVFFFLEKILNLCSFEKNAQAVWVVNTAKFDHVTNERKLKNEWKHNKENKIRKNKITSAWKRFFFFLLLLLMCENWCKNIN